MSRKNFDHPEINKKLLTVLDETVKSCQQLYQDRAKSFAVVLNELEMLTASFQKRLSVAAPETKKTVTGKVSQNKNTKVALQADEKYVYVRLFHREMSNLTMSTANKSWIKPLLESVKSAEKHGLAVYANEEDVQRSLRGPNYAYATLRIHKQQDITDKRDAKSDPTLNCPLLAIENITIEQLVKLTYQQVDYPIQGGVMHLPNSTLE